VFNPYLVPLPNNQAVEKEEAVGEAVCSRRAVPWALVAVAKASIRPRTT